MSYSRSRAPGFEPSSNPGGRSSHRGVCRSTGGAPKSASWPGSEQARVASARARDERRRPVPAPRDQAVASTSPGSSPPAARSLLAFALLAGGLAAWCSRRARRRYSPLTHGPGHRRARRGRAAGRARSPERGRREPARPRRRARRARSRGAADGRAPRRSTARSRTRSPSSSCPSGPWRSSARARAPGSSPRAGASWATSSAADAAGCPRIWVDASCALEPGRSLVGDPRTAVAAVAPLAAGAAPGQGQDRPGATGRADAGARAPASCSGSASRPTSGSSCASRAGCSRSLAAGTAYLDVSVPERPVAGTTLNSQVEVESQASTTT